ncbi:MAG TPA: hypothetical protein VMT43_11145, partial [Acidimicrobiales bacterium]|nr:hypothetical protein [Acidimicrobiales bacterium]
MTERWAFAAVWVTLPFTTGPAFADALAHCDPLLRTVTSVGLWSVWAVTLGAALIPRTVTLTGIRIVAPATIIGAGWAAIAAPAVGAAQVVALAVATLAAVVALSAGTGAAFVNGSAYGLERRLPLRAPGPLLLGPVELAWAVTVV